MRYRTKALSYWLSERTPAGRVPVTVVFFALGAVTASWAARLPAIRQPLHLSPQALGLALLGPALGAVVAMPLTGAVLTRVSPRPVVLTALFPLTALVPLITVAADTAELFAVLFGWGVSVGVVDVAMNLEAAAVQRRLGKRVMSRFHASYSIGGLAGAGLGAICAATGISVRGQLLSVSGGLLIASLTAAWRFDRTPIHVESGSHGGRRGGRPHLSWVLVGLSTMAFASFLAEGAANDWSAVYLHSSLGASSGLAALGYTFFASAMAIGRLFGDRLADRWGPSRLVRWSSALGATGFAIALATATPVAALVGLSLLGFGLASVVPHVFSSTSQLHSPGPALAVVTSFGYSGMLVGPPAIGALAGAVGLTTSLTLVATLAALISMLAGTLRPPASARSDSGACERADSAQVPPAA
jgi:MFS family permease